MRATGEGFSTLLSPLSSETGNRTGTRVRERTARATNQDLGEETPRVRKRRAPIPADEVVTLAPVKKEKEYIRIEPRASTSKLIHKEPGPPKQKISLKLRMPEYDRDYENTPTYHSSSKRPNAAARFNGTSCHHCKARTLNIVRCEIKACHAIWCERCINTRYREPHDAIISAPSSMPLCPCCQDICQCARCRRVRSGFDARTSESARARSGNEPKSTRTPRQPRASPPGPLVFERSNLSPDEFESVDDITARIDRERRARKRPDRDDSASALTPNLSEERGSRSVSSSLASSSEDDSDDELEMAKVVITPRLSRASSVVWSAGPERKRMKRDKPPRRRVESYDNISFGDVSMEEALDTLHLLNVTVPACQSPLPSYLHVDLSPPPNDEYILPPETVNTPSASSTSLVAPRSVERFSVSPAPFDAIPLAHDKHRQASPFEQMPSTTPAVSPTIAPDWLTSPTSKPVQLPREISPMEEIRSTTPAPSPSITQDWLISLSSNAVAVPTSKDDFEEDRDPSPLPESVRSTTPALSPSIAPDWLTSPTTNIIELPAPKGTGLDSFGSTVRRLLVAGSSMLGLSLVPLAELPIVLPITSLRVPIYSTSTPTSPGLLTPDSLQDLDPFSNLPTTTTTTTIISTEISSTYSLGERGEEFSLSETLKTEIISSPLGEKVDDGLDVGDWSCMIKIEESETEWSSLGKSEEGVREIY